MIVQEAERPSLGRDCLVCAGVVVGLGIWTRPLWPADTVHRVETLVVPIAAGTLMVLTALVLMAMAVASASGRGWRYQLYRRRWIKALSKTRLTDEKRDELLAPKLKSVTSDGTEDVLRIRMLDGQSPKDWDLRASRLATELGAASGRIAWRPDRIDEVELILVRPQGKRARAEAAETRQARKIRLQPGTEAA
ncbi:hypothetical protein ACFXHA_43540 [Nocardia sp. NPDC059240]|uniref:hypothetical protein n=1 Tax=Nocardia sp. NPDC059240 TaxID=3346786 RepID=UPI00368FD17F